MANEVHFIEIVLKQCLYTCMQEKTKSLEAVLFMAESG